MAASKATVFQANTLKAQVFASSATTGKPMQTYNAAFIALARQAGRAAATQATAVSRQTFTSRLSGRPIAPARRNRPTTQGQFAQFINWDFDRATDKVNFDLGYLESAAPYWAIQEIGTGRSANILQSTNGPGAVTVRSQRGRRISSALVWAGGPGLQAATQARGARNDQLFLRSQVLANSVRSRRIRINKEIKAKHYLRDGAKTAFGLYRKDLTKAFRQTYK